jgi:hypothetical protein
MSGKIKQGQVETIVIDAGSEQKGERAFQAPPLCVGVAPFVYISFSRLVILLVSRMLTSRMTSRMLYSRTADNHDPFSYSMPSRF